MPDQALKSNPEAPPSEEDGKKIVETLKTQLEELRKAAEFHRKDAQKAKEYVTALVAKMDEQASQAPKRDPEEEADRFLEAFKSNPTGALQSVIEDHWHRRMQPIVTESLTNQAHQMKTLAIQEIGKQKWDKYGEEVEEFMSGMSPSMQAKPGAWQEAYRFIVAKHLDEEVEERLKQKLEKETSSQLEGSSRAGGGAYRGGDTLSELERKIAREFNMSDEEWLSNKKSYERWEK